MDGIILNYDPKSATGIIKTEDGKLFPFKKANWQERRMPRPNDRVDFEAAAGAATYICYVQEKDDAVPAKTTAKAGVNIDIGLIAGGYAVVFFMAAIVDSLINLIGLDANDMIGLFVILDLVTVAAWIWGTNYKIMRGIATLCAVLVTALAVFILVRHGLQADA
jgi:hypothetical protein